MEIKTVRDLRDFLSGQGEEVLDSPIYFDTCARTFEYHMARIGSAYIEENPTGETEKFLGLFEARRA